MKILHIVRHGETKYNTQGKYLGRTDQSLNTKGRQQALGLVHKVADLNIDLIISSPLKRTLETAEIIKPNKLQIIIEPSFIERSIGVYEGLTREQAKKKFPNMYKKDITRISNDAPTNGETILEVRKRVFNVLDNINKIYSGKNILIVTHAFVAKVINYYFNQQISEDNFFKFVLQNAEIKSYKFQ